jgi:hypothetical protein
MIEGRHHRVAAVVRLRLLAFVLAGVAVHADAAATEPPRAQAVEFAENVVYHPPENPGFAAWVQLWPERAPG